MKRPLFGLGIVVLLLSLSLPVYGTTEEVLFGKYSFESDDLRLSFHWGEEGITHMEVNGKKIDDAAIEYFSYSVPDAYNFTFRDSDGNSHLIRLVFLVAPTAMDDLKMAAGYYARWSPSKPDQESHLSFVKAIELKFTR